MMKKLKFRAWDKSDKVMLYEGIDYPTENLNYTYSFLKKQLVLQLQGENSIYEGYELMQYSGLKDENGSEIYEGDILKDACNNLYIVTFIRGCFYLKTKYEKDGEWLEWLPMCEITQLAEPENFYRIGNIYENPELLA